VTALSGILQPRWRRRLLALVIVWLCLTGGALWLHRRPPVADVILAPLPGWQVQVWFGVRTTIEHSPGRQGSPALPIVMVFYDTPFSRIRLLARLTLPAWPLGLSAALLGGLALLAIGGTGPLRRRSTM
jgi:hypothetical protein